MLGTMKSFVICGPESAGNRLLAQILIDCGLRGSADYFQPKEHRDIDFSVPWVVINHFDKLSYFVNGFKEHGHEVTMLIPIREYRACTESMVYHHKHRPTIENAGRSILQIVGTNVGYALAFGINCEIVPYESLNERMLEHFLRRHGLVGVPKVIVENRNERWY